MNESDTYAQRFERNELRDQFATAALFGLLSAQAYSLAHHDNYAESAYRFADAMMVKRESNGQNVKDEIQKAKEMTWAQAIEFIEDTQHELWRVDSPEAEAARWLVLAMKKKA
jgi:hypothetical protein